MGWGWTGQVVEAVLEDVSLKQRIFADLEKACRPDCILSSNTSTIDISLIGAKTRAQVVLRQRCPCNPCHCIESSWTPRMHLARPSLHKSRPPVCM